MKTLEKYLSKLEQSISKFSLFYRFLKKCKVRYQKTKYHLLKFIGSERDIIYGRSFFDKNLEWNIPIAKTLIDSLIKYFHPKSVVDVGCGNAEFLCQFQKKGIIIKGYDGSSHAIDSALVDRKFIELVDLRNQIESPQRYDLALCLEVAEHIERRYSEILINSLVNLSDTVIFTAAPPGQGGHFHINEQPKEFWIDLWNKKGFKFMDNLTESIKEEFRINKVLRWYCDNLMVFRKSK